LLPLVKRRDGATDQKAEVLLVAVLADVFERAGAGA
jgi:hypothetical protein